MWRAADEMDVRDSTEDFGYREGSVESVIHGLTLETNSCAWLYTVIERKRI